ncbi:RHS repeat-associated core domain-containing protein [Pseudoalteromonas sp. RB2-MNA-CIBAN-0110]|uniref:RHS repeat-associated core domain-containing protein n=1 Tax=Pseudoalteromonas sp. RB2-MNA-CIBAN-0110 TaxID=3140439 RepID=UPI00331EE598
MNRIFFVFILMLTAVLKNTIVEARSVTYIHSDLLGTPIVETDEGGNVIWRDGSTPYGKAIKDSSAASTNTVGFTGHQNDRELGLTYMQARYYDPVIGRFYSNDPVGFRDVHSFNRYTYANNNPYRYTDPNGKSAILVVPPPTVGVPIAAGGTQHTGGRGSVGVPPYLTTSSPNTSGVTFDFKRTTIYKAFNAVFNESAEDIAKGKITDLIGGNPKGADFENAPGEGWTWKGNPNAPVGSAQGAWVNPETGEQLHNDLDTHAEGTARGPHVTYTDVNGKRFDYFPNDDRVEKQ